MDKQALELNTIIQEKNAVVYELLSEQGKMAFFPKCGILSQAAQANGKKINATMGIATEDDGSPMRLDCLTTNIGLSPEKIFLYAPSFGKSDIRAKWQEFIYNKNPSLNNKTISLPVVTNALTHGLSIIGQMFFNKKDEVIISNLYWENYDLVFEQPFGVKFDLYSAFKGSGLDILSFEKKMINKSNEKKIVLLNFPNNPTGYTPTIEEAKAIIRIIKESAEMGNKLIVILDDAYFGLVYEKNIYKESLFTELADLHQNVLAVKVDGATKEDYAWGFRIGFITYGIKGGDSDLYAALEAKTAGLIRGSISSASNVAQSLLMNAYANPKYIEQKQRKYETLKSRYQVVVNILEEHKEYSKYFKPLPFNSGYFMCVELVDVDCEELRKLLLTEYSTGVICFGGVIRLAFSAIQKELIPELFENLYDACKKLAS